MRSQTFLGEQSFSQLVRKQVSVSELVLVCMNVCVDCYFAVIKQACEYEPLLL